MASCAIPGIFPPVEIDGHLLVDGALANNTAISVAIDAGADTVYVLPTGYPCAVTGAPSSALGALSHAAALLVHQRVVQDSALYAGSVNLKVLPPPCPITINVTDFGHAVRLVGDARATANRWLGGGGGDAVADAAAHIALHTH